jgi:serine/threonine-protein kinase ULK/ATG1
VNIVRFFDFIKTGNNNYIIFEYCAGGDLKGFLKEEKRLSEIVVQRFVH